MRRTIETLIIVTILLSVFCWPQLAQASTTVEKISIKDKQDASIMTDDIAACIDDPSPMINGQNPGIAGKPVNLLSGVEAFTRNDLTIGTLFPISVTRRYDSRSGYDSPVGYGWAINYDRRLYTYPDGSVTLRKECGWKKRFAFTGGSYVTPPGENGTLIKNEDGSYTFTYKSGDKDNYDSRGRLVARIDAKGNSVIIFYEMDTRSSLFGLLPANVNQTNPLIVSWDYRLSRIEEKDASGTLTNQFVLFHYDSTTGRLTDIVDNTGRTVTYTHDGIGNLTGISGPSGSVTYGYTDTNFTHRMTSVDEGQGVYANTYDTRGRVLKQTHGTGVIDFEYTTPFKKTKITTTIKDSAGNTLNSRTRTVEYDNNGQVNKVTDTLGNVTNFTRDSNMYITREEYLENVGTISSPTLTLSTANTYTYDAKGNVLAKTYAQGTSIEKTTTYTYHPTFNSVLTETVQSVVNPAQNRVTTNTYDEAKGNLLSTTETGLLGDGTAYSYTTTYGYNTNGKLTSIDGPRTDVQDVTSYTYDTVTGFLTSMSQPLIGTTTYANHEPHGNPQTVTDPNGNGTTYTYDATGRVQTVKAPGDTNPTQYFYVAGGCQSCGGANKIDHITLPEGNAIWYTYDAMGNLSSILDSLNNGINYTYDSEGNKLTEQIKDSSGSLQKSLSCTYDQLNRLKRITNPDASYTEYTYDFRGSRLSAKDPRTNTTNYAYDDLNRLTSVTQPGSISTAYGYNSNNNLTSVTDANSNTTTYRYDDKGRVYQTISPDTGTTTYSYDPAGNMISKTDAKGVTISYTYDAANRLTRIHFPTNVDTVYAYDNCLNGKGRVCSMTDAGGTTVYEYWPKGQVKKKTTTTNNMQQVIQYAYDQNGNLKTITELTGEVITNNYSNDKAISVLKGAANLATSINYKPFGGVSSLVYGNGIAGSISYDNQYRVTGIAAGSVMNLSYPTYDANGNITAINNALDPTKNKTFGYDTLNRLASATASGLWGSLSWTYDGVGNRQTENATAYTYVPGANKLNTVGDVSYSFDSNGNTTSQGTRQYTYNENQRLVQVVDGAMTATYTYNGLGQRVKKVVNGVTTIFYYDESGQLIAESDGTGTITAVYVYLNGQPLAKIEGTNVYYYHNDALGTPQKMTDASGTVVWAADYKPFGEATITVSTITNNLRFPGQYFDQETGLHYNYYRDYSPFIGRYAQADPVGLIPQGPRAGLNHLYVYVSDNPIGWTDPKGLGNFPFTPPSGCEYYKKKCDEKKCPPDQYACKVYKCCKAFGDDPTANCIRGCLIAFDQRNCANLTGEARNHCRQLAHWDCYDRCLGHGMGASGLLTGPPAECQDAMDEVGGMGFGQ